MIARIEADIKQAMRAKNKELLLVLRSLKTDLMNRKIEKMDDLNDEEALEVVRKAVKSREQAAELYDKGDRDDLAANERAEADLLREYLPKALSENEVREIVQSAIAETGATSMKEMGGVMKLVMARSEGLADGKLVSKMVRDQLAAN